MTAPALALPTDADETAELAAIGVTLNQPMGPSEIDAFASDLLRQMAETEADLERYNVAEHREVMRLRARYDTLRKPAGARHSLLYGAVMALAARADFGKAKSRKVGFGSYGHRTLPLHLQVTDPAALLAWAKASSPTLVRQTVREDVPQKSVAAYFDRTGEVPDGVEFTAAHDVAFAKPDPIQGDV
jgi:hypothetical protein